MKRALISALLFATSLFAQTPSSTGFDFSPAKERSIVVIVPSFNNARYYQANLDSIYAQKYENYRVIYIDDCSTDNTFELVKAHITERNMWRRTKLIHNESRRGAMANLYRVIHQCKDHEIVVTIDGDDWAATPEMFARINQAYANPNVWITYGQFIFYPQGNPGYCGQITADGTSPIRQQCGLATHPRTFYAGLFKKIAQEDLLYEGEFYNVTWDKAMMAPMLEMANGKWQFIQDILYVYNYGNPLSDATLHGDEQNRMCRQIMQKPAYKPLEKELPFERKRPDLVVFSYDRPLQLYAFLESVEQYVEGLGHVSVIYRTSDEKFEQAYQELIIRFAGVSFLKQETQESFKQLTLAASFETPNDYIVYAVDDIVVKEYTDLSDCIRLLEKHNAYGFYLRLGKNLTVCYPYNNQPQRLPHFLYERNKVCVWQFSQGELDWAYPNTVDMTVYRKKHVAPFLQSLNYNTPNTLEAEWAGYGRNVMHAKGLCYKNSKIVNLPLNRVSEFGNKHMGFMEPKEMLTVFEENQKIDIAPLYRSRNIGAHTAYAPTFVTRR